MIRRNQIFAVLAWTALYGAWGAAVCARLAKLPYLLWFDAVFYGAALFGLLVIVVSRLRKTGVARYGGYSLAYPLVWEGAVHAADRFQFAALRAQLVDYGLGGLFLLGMGWLVWYLERRWRLRTQELRHVSPMEYVETSNPFEPDAWYYGKRNAKLNQSLFVLSNYGLLFFAACLLVGRIDGCQELDEIPGGGGKPVAIAQTVKIQKVIKKKFVINPYSSIIFKPPPIDDVKLQLVEKTAHKYAIGQGSGDGAGFGGGTSKGKVRFIRLEYSGGDWDQDFGIGADLNLLIEYGVRTGHKVAEETESRTISQLDNFPVGSSPPLMYLTGQKNISLTKGEIRTLREYLLDKHGMLFIDNGGYGPFEGQAFQMMQQVVPEIEKVRVPADDPIYGVPYILPKLPYVAKHGSEMVGWGWKLDGRWICYYHPGDVADGWVDTQKREDCLQLGINVLFYAYSEYSKWLEARGGR